MKTQFNKMTLQTAINSITKKLMVKLQWVIRVLRRNKINQIHRINSSNSLISTIKWEICNNQATNPTFKKCNKCKCPMMQLKQDNHKLALIWIKTSNRLLNLPLTECLLRSMLWSNTKIKLSSRCLVTMVGLSRLRRMTNSSNSNLFVLPFPL